MNLLLRRIQIHEKSVEKGREEDNRSRVSAGSILFPERGGKVDESPIERAQREFFENSRKSRPAKTAGSEYVGVFVFLALVALIFIVVFSLA